MEDLYILESGIKRKAEKHNCEQCGKEFLRRKNASRPKKYCSKKCHEVSRRKRTIVKCTNCGKDVEKKTSQLKNAKHGFHFCNRKCKEEAQKLGGKCPKIRPAHFGTSKGRETYRKLIANAKNPICEECQENTIYLLQVHHKDGDKNNNIESNFEIVCSNCHVKRHLKFNGDRWIFSTKSLTPRNMLSKL